MNDVPDFLRPAPMTEDRMIELLSDWALLNNQIGKYDHEQLKALLNYECTHKKRYTFIERIHRRYAKLVTAVERDFLMKGGTL